jgi:polysaccharide deacetylase 2 family uncharacterized protein YibQ
VSKGEAFWVTVIVLALAAIGAGYMSGASTARVPHHVTLAPHAAPSVHPVLRDPSDAAVVDLFSRDDVVVERARTVALRWAQPKLAIVVGLCGFSAAADARFAALSLPVAFDIDPDAPNAVQSAQLAREAHDLIFAHVGTAPTVAQLARLQHRLGHLDGIASRESDGFVQSLDGTGLMFFDERGDADADDFTRVGIPVVQRDVTADDRTAATYVRFMLQRAAQQSERDGRLVVLLRPHAGSLDALSALAATRTVDFVPLRASS